ncbi:MAG: hypothetical protein ACE5FC_07570, partial [Myxococcota bacterium]
IEARARCLAAAGHLWRIGKGRPVDRAVLQDSGAVSGTFIDEVAALAARIEDVQSAGVVLTFRDLAITGEDVMRATDIPEGPLVGVVLDVLLEKVIEDPTLNKRDRLLALLADLASGRGIVKC